MPDLQKATYTFRARELQHVRRDEINDQIVELNGKMDVLRARARAVGCASSSQPCRMASCRLTSVQRARLDDLVLDGRWRDSVVETLRSEAVVPIGPPLPRSRPCC